jgi:predicted transposase YdaD
MNKRSEIFIAMKTDTLFYRLFQSFPSLFFELIQLSPAEAGNYQFASVEVKQLAFRIDGVLLPTSNCQINCHARNRGNGSGK